MSARQAAGPATPTAATPTAPDTASKRQGAPAQQYHPAGFTSQRSPLTNASPGARGAGAAPSHMGFASKGGAAMEKGVYTEVSTPYTPVGAFTRRAVQRPAEASPKVTTVAGGTAQPAAVQSTPLTPQRVQGGGATPAPKRLTR